MKTKSQLARLLTDRVPTMGTPYARGQEVTEESRGVIQSHLLEVQCQGEENAAHKFCERHDEGAGAQTTVTRIRHLKSCIYGIST